MKRKQLLLAMIFVIAMLCALFTACSDIIDDVGDVGGGDDRGDDDVGHDDDEFDDDTAPPAPPDEAIEACEGMEVGDECEFEGMDGEALVGTCEQIDEFVACLPEGNPPPM